MRRLSRTLRRIVQIDEATEHRDNGVANVFVERAAVFKNNRRHFGEVFVELLHELIRLA